MQYGGQTLPLPGCQLTVTDRSSQPTHVLVGGEYDARDSGHPKTVHCELILLVCGRIAVTRYVVTGGYRRASVRNLYAADLRVRASVVTGDW